MLSNRSIIVIATTLVMCTGGLFLWALWPAPARENPRVQAPLRERFEQRKVDPLLHPQRPSRPPVPGRDHPQPASEARAPDNLEAAKIKAFAEAIEAGYARPGEVAFRAMIDTFVEYNHAFAEARAREEGLTIDEIRELTYFGFVALETQRWPDVEELVGEPLSEAQRADAEALLHASNREFKAEIRELVDAGAREEERMELILATQERYLSEYYELTGMNEALLDELLAGDPSRTLAPVDTPPPESFEPAEPPPPIEPRPSR